MEVVEASKAFAISAIAIGAVSISACVADTWVSAKIARSTAEQIMEHKQQRSKLRKELVFQKQQVRVYKEAYHNMEVVARACTGGSHVSND